MDNGLTVMSIKRRTPPSEYTPVLLDDPNKMAGCYYIHAYCKYSLRTNNSGLATSVITEHDWQTHFIEITGETRASCIYQLKSLGWLVHEDGTCTCAVCGKILKSNV